MFIILVPPFHFCTHQLYLPRGKKIPSKIFQWTHCNGESGMNPVAMTIIVPLNEHWPNQCPPVLKSCTLSTELSVKG